MTYKALAMAIILMSGACAQKPKDSAAEAPETPRGSAKGYNKAPPREAGDASLYQPILEARTPGLGFAIDLDNHMVHPTKCLDGEVETIPTQEGMLALDAEYTRSDIESYLGASARVRANYLFWGGSARAHFVHKSREQDYGLQYIVFVYNKDHTEVFHPTGRKEHLKNASAEEWTQKCGSGYAAAIDNGSMLIIKFSLQLERSSSSQNWGSRGKGRYLSFAKLRAAISGNSRSKRDRGRLSLSAIQLGGKPSELGKILQSESDSGVIENFALCDVEDVKKCLRGLRSIENYIANEFPKQIDDDEDRGGSRALATYPFRYPKNMGAKFNPGIAEFVIKSREDLRRLYEEEMEDIVRLNQFASEDDEQAQETLAKARANVAALRETAPLCYVTESYDECAAKTEELAIACSETVVDDDIDQFSSGGESPSEE